MNDSSALRVLLSVGLRVFKGVSLSDTKMVSVGFVLVGKTVKVTLSFTVYVLMDCVSFNDREPSVFILPERLVD